MASKLKVYNTLTRKKDVFKSLKKGQVLMYNCGPTVYDTPHLGNYRSFFMADMIRRWLEYLGYRVKQVINITDIDDKTIKRSGEMGLTLKQLTSKYEKEFFHGLKSLNIKPAFKYPRATENFKDMVRIVQALVTKGYAYEMAGSVYFDISKFKRYGRLSRVNIKGIKPGARVDVDEYAKDSPIDFVLMKKSTLEELKRGIYFKSPWGNVRPGWHIECSTMVLKYLGKTIDIHTGGVDNIFPHHENEIAQSEAFTGKRFVRYWIHGEHLIVNGEKMSKSKGNYLLLEDIIKKYGSDVVRYIFLSTHYRKKLNYTEKLAKNAERNYQKLLETKEKLKASGKDDKKFLQRLKSLKKKFIDAMNDDLNTPLVLRVFHQLSKEVNKRSGGSKSALSLFNEFADVLGLKFDVKKERIPQEISILVRKREEARKRRDWRTADNIREELRKKGYSVEDTGKGVRVRKI